jgi:hypothetical protein
VTFFSLSRLDRTRPCLTRHVHGLAAACVALVLLPLASATRPRAAHPTEFAWREPTVNAPTRVRGIDRLAGTDALTKAVDDGTIEVLLRQWNADAMKFEASVKPYLLYR